MRYIEVDFTCNAMDTILKDILTAYLGEIEFESFVENDHGIFGYIQEDLFEESQVKLLLKSLPICSNIIFTYKLMEDKDWNEEWEKNYFEPLIIDDECIIRSSFHEIDSNQFKYSILIDPRMAFGTGHHQTTELMLREILKLDLSDKIVLDMGCGTAILSILASKRGAKSIIGIDIDKWAFDNAKENISLNDMTNIDIIMGGVDAIGNHQVDVLFANINRNILLRDMQYYVKALRKGGILYMSGFYKEDLGMIKSKAVDNGLIYSYYEEKDNWIVVKFHN